MDILWDALVDARKAYYRDVNFKDLPLGGLNGVKAVATTKGLEAAFPKLGDEAKRQAFLAAIEERIVANKDATDVTEQITLRETLKKLAAANRDTVELPEEVLVSEFADGAFAELDPFTSMIWPTDVDEFRKSTSGEFSGVGIQIQSDEDGSLKVVSPLEDSPAYKAGIKAGDVITHINGKNAKGITLNQAVKNITGERGTVVVLTVKSPDGKSKDYTIRRDTIHVASIKGWLHKAGGGWDWFVDPDNKIAYMRMTNFTQDTAKELDKALDQVKQAGGRGMILDLRYNPGGLLTAATDVCDKFLSDGVIVSTHPDRETGNPATVARAKPGDDEADLPIIVLVNQYSASASEIVSGCLKDQKRALIVGERTFGKGSVQMLFPLADRSALLKLTTSHYYLPLGKCIHREENSTDWGVDPDVTVEMTPEQMRAAIDARQELDILRDAPTPAEGKLPNLKEESQQVKDAVKDATGKDGAPPKKKDLLSSDPQLSAALLMLRLQLAGARL
jgi:carboxyl-terminal processing protease